MYDLFFSDGAAWFSIPAFVGSAFFLLRIVMLLAGAGHGGGDFHGDIGHGGGHHSDSGHDFQILSVQSIAAFMMGFGWGALAGYRAMHWEIPASLAFGCVAGGGMVYLLAILLKGMADLQSSGTVSIEGAAGREGDVYVKVPADQKGGGQVRVNIGDRQRIFNAISSGEELPSGTRIRVLKVNSDNTVTVSRA
jgi:hypothetical protein